jgi:hypothetical protein
MSCSGGEPSPGAEQAKGDEVMRKTRVLVNFGVLLVLITLSGRLNAQSGPSQFVPFNDFLASIRAADSGEYLARPTSRVKDAASFEEMRHHILTMYEGVEVSHTFVLDSSYFDCIPIMQQPSVRIPGLKSIASAPPQSVLAPPSTAGGEAAEVPVNSASQVDPENPFDEFGNSVVCEENTIPMRRLTLEEMTRFPTLRRFFQKAPDGAGEAAESGPANPPEATHKYAYMQQDVPNLGGNSNLNIWSPYVDTSKGDVFSLSQEWYVGGSGDKEQTAEVGWQNYPAKYGDETSRLFIYWTPNNYNKAGPGCYNLECEAFVQVANNGDLGAGFTHYSTSGGPQYDFGAEYYLYNGNWWLGIQGTWIGYYPGSIYHGGQLTKGATIIEFGAESVGTTHWPPAGSGAMPTGDPYKDFGHVAYQRNLYYIQMSGVAQWYDNLKGHDPSPNCYQTSGPFYSSSSGWDVYFYVGGRGGPRC